MFEDIRLVATDLDGTFIQPGTFYIPPEDFELIRELKRNGIVFAAASGRPYSNMRHMFAPVADDMMFICDNGCSVIWQDRAIYREPMDQNVCFELVDYVEQLPPEYENVMCTAENYVLMPKRDEDVITMLRDWNMSVRIVKNKEGVIDPILKYSIFNTNGLSLEFRNRMKEQWCGKVKHISESCVEWLDFQDGDKGTGLRIAAEHLGIRLENTAAFGDSFNDVELLDAAGYSYAMSNASDSVKAHAKYVCSGVQDVLRELLNPHAQNEHGSIVLK